MKHKSSINEVMNTTTLRKRNIKNYNDTLPSAGTHPSSVDDKNKSGRSSRFRESDVAAVQENSSVTFKDDTTLDQNDKMSQQQRRRRKSQFEELHQEMELVSYSISETGHARRILPRHLSSERTQKRRLLEKRDDSYIANETSNEVIHDTSNKQKIRGPMAASEDHIVQASLIFGAKSTLNTDHDENECEASENEDNEENISIQEDVVNEENDVDDEGEDGDQDSRNDEDQALDPVEGEVEDVEEIELLGLPSNSSTTSKGKRNSSLKFPSMKRKKSTRLQRLKNFKSTRMAERHGAALGAHVQGKPNVAIKKLKQIAASVPLAPQIYSSLGLVYEDLFMESQRKNARAAHGIETNETRTVGDSSGEVETSKESEGVMISPGYASDKINRNKNMEQDIALREQLNLAKKTYGSYHVAAILYKRDYSLWVRAADSAYEIAMVHTKIMTLSELSNDVLEYHRSEKKHWLTEARNDYQTADNLNPPGIEVQAKLAHVMIDLDMLSDALTLLTGIKNRVEFDNSYRTWLLFADLMLRIGHECNQWNAGIQTHENKMFRRWLRKWSMIFDWKERRMQALVKSLEAACGSMCSRALMKWMQYRVDQGTNDEYILALDDDNTNLQEDVSHSLRQENNQDYHTKSVDQIKTTIEERQSVTASCPTVFAISSELLRLMLDMQLYEGGKLVGETVSQYLKERQIIFERRQTKKAEFEFSQQKTTNIFAMQPEGYDTKKDDADSADSDDEVLLSDDEDWNSDAFSPSLRKGKLPPELLFLYGLCLLGKGENELLACTCIQSLRLLPFESILWLTGPVIDYRVVRSTPWMIFHEVMTKPFGVLTSLAIATDVIRRCRMEAKLSTYLSSLYSSITKAFLDKGWLDSLQNFKIDDSVLFIHRRDLFVKVMLTTMRCELCEVKKLDDLNIFISIRLPSLLSQVSKLMSAIWNVPTDGSVDQNCVDAMDIVFSLLQIHNKHILDVHDDALDKSVLDQMPNIMCIICGIEPLKIPDMLIPQAVDVSDYPVKSIWLSSDLESISRRVVNLCIGMNVANRSGWISKTFSANSRHFGSHVYVGITTDEGPMSGYIPEFIEDEIAKQWKLIQERTHCKIAFDVIQKLQVMKNSIWYKENRTKYLALSTQTSIVNHGEDKALFILLCVSRACLNRFYEAMNEGKVSLVSLSILLPLTQFFLKEEVWDANIGLNAVNDASVVHEWLDSTTSTFDNVLAPSHRPGYIRPSKRQASFPSDMSEGKALHEWFSWENEYLPASNFFDVEFDRLLRVWQQLSNPAGGGVTSNAKGVMQDVDQGIKLLRLSYSVQAAQRCSIEIAANLLKLLEFPECQNPFAVIQLAAIYASQGSTGASTDQFFRAKLPKPEDCTTRDALLVLGRAECLNAIQLCPEAAFLCNYIANVSRSNCQPDPSLHTTDKRWLVLSILAYNLSVTIRIMEHSLLRNTEKRENVIGTWSDTAIEWFHQIRQTKNLLDEIPESCKMSSETVEGVTTFDEQDTQMIVEV